MEDTKYWQERLRARSADMQREYEEAMWRAGIIAFILAGVATICFAIAVFVAVWGQH